MVPPNKIPKQIDFIKKGHPFSLPSWLPPEAVVEIGKDQVASGIDGAA